MMWNPFRRLWMILGLGAVLALGCTTQPKPAAYVPPVQQPIGTPSPQILVPGP